MVVITGEGVVTKVRLGAEDVALVRSQAKARELCCHDYLKSVIHQALRKAEKTPETPQS
jgi:predicted DNA binding CopG/RHH family protein